jgi:hypothetical protein
MLHVGHVRSRSEDGPFNNDVRVIKNPFPLQVYLIGKTGAIHRDIKASREMPGNTRRPLTKI